MPINRMAVRETHIQTGTHADRQTDRHTHTHTHTCIVNDNTYRLTYVITSCHYGDMTASTSVNTTLNGSSTKAINRRWPAVMNSASALL